MLKAKCIECSKKGFATLLIESGSIAVGKLYKLIDITIGTLAQNGTLHELLTIFYDWMLKNDTFIIDDDDIVYNLKCSDDKELKGIIKQKYGLGFEKIYYADIENGKPVINEADTYDQLPLYAREDFIQGNKKRLKGKLVSWSDYTLANRKTVISRLMLIMDRFGVDTEKYLDMRKSFDDKEVKYINRVANKFNGQIIGG